MSFTLHVRYGRESERVPSRLASYTLTSGDALELMTHLVVCRVRNGCPEMYFGPRWLGRNSLPVLQVYHERYLDLRPEENLKRNEAELATYGLEGFVYIFEGAPVASNRAEFTRLSTAFNAYGECYPLHREHLAPPYVTWAAWREFAQKWPEWVNPKVPALGTR